MNFDDLVSSELARRGWHFTIDEPTARLVIHRQDGDSTLCLDNLRKEVSQNEDPTRIRQFFDSIDESWTSDKEPLNLANLFWTLEPNDYHEKPYIFEAISSQVDKVLINFNRSAGLLNFVTPEMLESSGLTQTQAEEAAWDNLDAVVKESKVECMDVEGTKLGMVSTQIPFKTALLLAPSLKSFVQADLTWPILAVAPTRDFLYIWSAEDREFMSKVGTVVLNEYAKGAYPVSTEVFEVDDEGIGAIGVFSRKSST